jgi:hypothetical protein
MAQPRRGWENTIGNKSKRDGTVKYYVRKSTINSVLRMVAA